MLPTEGEGVIMTDVGPYNTDMIVISELPDNLKGHERPHNHIYITSDEEIENEDWYYSSLDEHIKQAEKDYGYMFKGSRHKIIATSDLLLTNKETALSSLPNISQSFIKEFVESGGKEDWEVDYYFKGRCKDPMVCLRGCSVSDGSCRHLEDKKEAIKLDLNNCIILSAVEEKMYSRDEVEELIRSVVKDISYGDEELIWHYKGEFRELNKWIKENL
jgi:hypothetical protein